MAGVLIISNTGDVHTDLLVAASQRAGLPCFRLNTDHFRRRGFLVWELIDGNAVMSIDGHSCNLAEIGLVIYRRPVRAYDTVAGIPPWQNKVLDMEWKAIELAMSTVVTGTVVNPVNSSAHARNKLIQLQLALSCGLRVPRTLVTTSLESLRSFLSQGDCITKGIDASYVFDGEHVRSGFTKKVGLADINGYDTTGCPTLLQEAIRPVAVWRIVTAGDQVFGVRYTGSSLEDQPDSRLIHEQLTGEQATVPGDPRKGITALCRQLGIAFASSDFIEDEKGHLYFVDLNPDGQWAWLQDEFGVQIADAIIELHFTAD